MKNRNIPFGYRFEGGKVVIDPAEQNTLQRICAEYLGGRSLLQIANGLADEKIEFAPGIVTWDKARIMRIIDDDRYLGNAVYPQIIDRVTAEQLRKRKASRSTQAGTDRKSGIYLLKVPVICTVCGSAMHRRQDTRCKCQQKWICDQCHTQIRFADSQLMHDLTELLNRIITSPDQLQKPGIDESEPTIEQRRIDNEIARTLEGCSFDKDALREKLLRRVSLVYLSVGNEAYTAYKLKGILEQCEVLDRFDAGLTNRVVSQIRLSESGPVSIILINGQEIRKEQADHASSDNPNGAA